MQVEDKIEITLTLGDLAQMLADTYQKGHSEGVDMLAKALEMIAGGEPVPPRLVKNMTPLITVWPESLIQSTYQQYVNQLMGFVALTDGVYRLKPGIRLDG